MDFKITLPADAKFLSEDQLRIYKDEYDNIPNQILDIKDKMFYYNYLRDKIEWRHLRGDELQKVFDEREAFQPKLVELFYEKVKLESRRCQLRFILRHKCIIDFNKRS
jgi:hypothetical protein